MTTEYSLNKFMTEETSKIAGSQYLHLSVPMGLVMITEPLDALMPYDNDDRVVSDRVFDALFDRVEHKTQVKHNNKTKKIRK